MAGVHTIDKLPQVERLRVIQALTEGGRDPDYRGIIKRFKLKCSHVALWRYHRDKVRPTLQRSSEAISKAMVNTNDHMDQGDKIEQQIEITKQAQELTRVALADDPIVQAVIAKRRRIEAALSETFETKAFDTFAKLESVDLRALEMHAKAIQHPGFVASAPQQTAGATVVVVMPTAADPRMQAWQQRQGAIDIKPDDE